MAEIAANPGGYFLEWSELKPGDCIVRVQEPFARWLWFREPVRLHIAHTLEEVSDVLQAMEGRQAVGFVSYDAGTAFDGAIRAQRSEQPLAWFAEFSGLPTWHRELAPCEQSPILDIAPSWDSATYETRFQKVHAALEAGDVYQVNLTFPIDFACEDAAAFFAYSCGVNPPPFAAFLHGGDWQVASFSPELFFCRQGAQVEVRPMKGTAALDGSLTEQDPKTAAENLMIVDMVRNDLGSICEIGSVQTPQLFAVERHGGLQQMISRVVGTTLLPLNRLFTSLFPPASVTGAPKIAATRLIADLEERPRGVYCGAIGIVAPGYERFAVGIRTAWIGGGKGEFGVGSGVVWDSTVSAEYEECLMKAERLLQPGKQWRLIEALPGGVYPDVHLARLASSASALGIAVDVDAIREELRDFEDLPKVRIEVRRDSRFTVEGGRSLLPDGPLRAIVDGSVHSRDPNRQVKTNSRKELDDALARHLEFDEVLLLNEHLRLAEFCRGNVVVKLDGRLVTPPPSEGCLPGIGAASAGAEYQLLTLEDLKRAQKVYLSNSVVGLREVTVTHR